jgi:hypothetical protein
VYRIPYADNEVISLGGSAEYFTHCAGMDIIGHGSIPIIVAAADGLVVEVIEHFDDCGSTGSFGPFGNIVRILHANGEMSGYLHLAQWSPSLYGIQPGMLVAQGDPIGIEGDVGRSNGNGSEPRVGTCLEDVPDDTGNCVEHLHWAIQRIDTGEWVNPYTCGLASRLYSNNSTYTAPCGGVPSPANQVIDGQNYSGFGTSQVFEAHQSIVAEDVSISNFASIVLHAGDSVTMEPGFIAQAGGYFRAEIGAPGQTAASDWPLPTGITCDDDLPFCFQWSDINNPGQVIQGCSTPGPDFGKCHGCFPGATRCCPCEMNGTCEF